MGRELPAHMKAYLKDPANKKRVAKFDKYLKKEAMKEKKRMKAKGYVLKGTNWIKYKK